MLKRLESLVYTNSRSEASRSVFQFLLFSERNWPCYVCFQVAQLNGKLTATQTTLTTRDQELREKDNEVEIDLKWSDVQMLLFIVVNALS